MNQFLKGSYFTLQIKGEDLKRSLYMWGLFFRWTYCEDQKKVFTYNWQQVLPNRIRNISIYLIQIKI